METESSIASGPIGPQDRLIRNETGTDDATHRFENINALSNQVPVRAQNGLSTSTAATFNKSSDGEENPHRQGNGNGIKRRKVECSNGEIASIDSENGCSKVEDAGDPPHAEHKNTDKTKNAASNDIRVNDSGKDEATPKAPQQEHGNMTISARSGFSPSSTRNDQSSAQVETAAPPEKATPTDEETEGVEKLIEARRQLFHSHANTTINEAVSALAEAPSLIKNTHPRGRAMWCTEDGEGSATTSLSTGNQEKNTRPRNILKLLAGLEDQSTDESIFLAKRRESVASISVEQLESTIKSQLYGNQLGVESLVLQFNECSASGISKWVSKQLNPPSSSSATPSSNPPIYYAAVNAKFRKCAICSRTGHYELECPEQAPRQTKRLMGLIALGPRSDRQNREQLHEDPMVQNPKPLSRWTRPKAGEETDDVLVESSGGFLIEQRRERCVDEGLPNYANVTERRHPNPLAETTDVDGFVIQATKDKPSGGIGLVSVDVGDLVAWIPRESDGVLYAGVALSSSLTDDKVLAIQARCISVVSRGPNKEADRKSAAIGQIYTLPKKKLTFLSDCIDKLPTLENDDASASRATANGIQNRRQPNAKHDGTKQRRLSSSRS